MNLISTNWNVFIFVEGNRNQRKGDSIAGYQPTKLANTDLFGGNNDDSSYFPQEILYQQR